MPGPTTPKSSTARRALRRSARRDNRAARLCWRRRGKRHVVADRPARDHGCRAALLGDERHPGPNGLGRTRRSVGTPVEGQLPADQRPGAVQLLQELRLARPDQSGQSDDLAHPDVEVEGRGARPGSHAAGRQDDVRSRPGLVLQRRGHRPEHGVHQLAGPERPRQDPRDDAVTQYDDSIGHLLDLDEVVRDEQNGDAARVRDGGRTPAGVRSLAPTGSRSARRGRAP